MVGGCVASWRIPWYFSDFLAFLATVGRNPAPVDVVGIPKFIGFFFVIPGGAGGTLQLCRRHPRLNVSKSNLQSDQCHPLPNWRTLRTLTIKRFIWGVRKKMPKVELTRKLSITAVENWKQLIGAQLVWCMIGWLGVHDVHDLHPSFSCFFPGTATGNTATRGDTGGTCHEHVEGVDLKGNFSRAGRGSLIFLCASSIWNPRWKMMMPETSWCQFGSMSNKKLWLVLIEVAFYEGS